MYPALPLKGTSPRSRSPSPFSDSSSVPEALNDTCQHIYTAAHELFAKNLRERRPRRRSTPLATTPTEADSSDALPSELREDRVRSSGIRGRGRGRSGSSRTFRSIPDDSSGQRGGNSPSASVVSPSREISRMVPSSPEIELTPRQQAHPQRSAQQSPAPRPAEVSFFTEQLYDTSTVEGTALQSSRDIWETPPSPSRKSIGPSNGPSPSPTSRSPAGREATLCKPTHRGTLRVTTGVGDSQEGANLSEIQAADVVRTGGDGRGASGVTSATGEEHSTHISATSAPAASSEISRRVANPTVCDSGATGGRHSSFVVKRQSGRGGHSRASTVKSNTTQTERSAASRTFEGLHEGEASQRARHARQHVSVTDGGGTSAAESAEIHMDTPLTRQLSPFERGGARRAPRVHHASEPSVEAFTDHSQDASMSAVTAASHQPSQVRLPIA